jgi:hypothetical protein
MPLLLRYFNEMVEATKLPDAQMLAAVQDLEKKHQGFIPRLSDWMAGPVFAGICAASSETRATLHCAIAGLGVERFR